MFSSDQEYFFKDLFIIIAALFGLVILVIIQFQNLGIRFRSTLKQSDKSLKENLILIKVEHEDFSINWSYQNHGFEMGNSLHYPIWHIGLFRCRRVNPRNKLHKINDHYWYRFSQNHRQTEKIMLPIFRKVFNRYKKRFESEKSIQFQLENNKDQTLFTWLKNENHIHSAIYTFIDESINIANEIKVSPTLLIFLGGAVYLDVVYPKNDLIRLFEKDFQNLFAVEMKKEEENIILRFWIAFSEEQIPPTCLQNYEKLNIHLDDVGHVAA